MSGWKCRAKFACHWFLKNVFLSNYHEQNAASVMWTITGLFPSCSINYYYKLTVQWRAYKIDSEAYAEEFCYQWKETFKFDYEALDVDVY